MNYMHAQGFQCSIDEEGYRSIKIASQEGRHLITLPYQQKAEVDYVDKLLQGGDLLEHIEYMYQNNKF